MNHLFYHSACRTSLLRYTLYGLLGCCILSGWAASYAAQASKEIYGPDYRLDIVEVVDEAIVEKSRAVGGLVLRNDVTQQGNGSYRLHSRALFIAANNGEAYGLCPDEPFSDQPALPFCTAFLVGPDIMVTAGHCMDFMPPEELAIVFGFQVNATGEAPTTLSADHVYYVREVVELVNTASQDYAIFQLDRRVPPNREPLNFRRIGKVQRNIPVGVIGHPLGLPLKVAFGEESVVYDNAYMRYFIANFDASAGNSGSPVINQLTGSVEGIYVYSTVEDLVYVEEGCWEQNRVSLDEAGQGVYRITDIAERLEEAIEESEAAWEAKQARRNPACGNGAHQVSTADARQGDRVLLYLTALLLLLSARAFGNKRKAT